MKDTLLSILGCKRLFLLIFAGILAGCSNLTSGFEGLPPVYVDATGSGKDSKAALDDAFRSAVLEASGVLLSSKMQLTNGSITKDEISEFSAGYIVAYEIKRTYENNQRTFVEIGALVSSSKLMGEYLFQKPMNGKVDGDQLYARTSTFLSTKEQGDRLLEHLGDSYPSQAVDINLGTVTSTVTENREIWLVVPYRAYWAKGFIEAFDETARYVAKGTCRTGTDKQPRRCDFNVAIFEGPPETTSGKGYLLADNAQTQILIKQFNDEVGFLIVVEGSGGNEIGRFCQRSKLPTRFINSDETSLSLANSVIEGRLLVQIANAQTLNKVSSVRVNLTKACF